MTTAMWMAIWRWSGIYPTKASFL